MARERTAMVHAPEACIDRPISKPNRSPANVHHIVPSTKIQSPIRMGICRPNRSDTGPTINCPTAKIARKTVMVDVTAALDTRRSAAIAGSEGRKIFVARIPVAANAQITTLQAMAVRCLGFVAGALLRTTSMLMACVSRACWPKRRNIGCRSPALPRLFRPDACHPEQLSFGCRPTNSGGGVGSSACGVGSRGCVA